MTFWTPIKPANYINWVSRMNIIRKTLHVFEFLFAASYILLIGEKRGGGGGGADNKVTISTPSLAQSTRYLSRARASASRPCWTILKTCQTSGPTKRQTKEEQLEASSTFIRLLLLYWRTRASLHTLLRADLNYSLCVSFQIQWRPRQHRNGKSCSPFCLATTDAHKLWSASNQCRVHPQTKGFGILWIKSQNWHCSQLQLRKPPKKRPTRHRLHRSNGIGTAVVLPPDWRHSPHPAVRKQAWLRQSPTNDNYFGHRQTGTFLFKGKGVVPIRFSSKTLLVSLLAPTFLHDMTLPSSKMVYQCFQKFFFRA
jgi:hypothetical protein